MKSKTLIQTFARPDNRDIEKLGYKPSGQKGYQPQSNRPVDPMKLTPPKGGSAVQPPPSGSQGKRSS